MSDLCGVQAQIRCVIPPIPRPHTSTLCLGAFEDTAFSSLADLVNENTLKAITDMGFIHMTEIQHKTIRPLLEGR